MIEPKDISYSSFKEEKDYIFDYKDVDISQISSSDIQGFSIHNISREVAVAKILEYIENKNSYRHILFLDPVKLMSLKNNKKLQPIAEKASLILHDGAGIRWAAEKVGKPLQEKISVISLMMDLLRYSEKKNLTIFFLGSTEENLEKLHSTLMRRFPSLRVVGRQAGHFSPKKEILIKEIIRKTNPDILFIAMDFPEQEIWIDKNHDCFSQSVVIGVSGNLDIVSGYKKKAPFYFQNQGLTWLWRILSRPYRLDKIWKTLSFFLYFSFQGWKYKRKK
ncbi:MAG: WecB/TagA/CpsF family glycosyltransferase [Leptospiraceae bacterium]|nr:WecB/TagA/CpsF family glycosyltransferase [Leptospiraceae bacterium]MCP5498437.1 WecB/TagA/CpsF family glycosyltransferase [Leptospiraceae bacterium]